jgi:diguanylate cyclase (GGDEF)-like protein/putative nucleotidyltransferase with HDIG domain
LPIHVTTTNLVHLLSTALLALFFFRLYRLKRQDYLLAWSAAWLLLALDFLSGIASTGISVQPWLRWIVELNEILLALSGLCFYCAARLYAGLTLPVRALAVAAGGLVLWAVANVNAWLNAPPIVLAAGLTYFLVAYTFWQEGRKQEARVDVLLAITFAGWGCMALWSTFRPLTTFLQGVDLFPLMFLPVLFTCVLMVMAVYEEERRRVERNMLALSNLNLAASSIVGGEIQQKLAQALDRVLNVVRIPVGALFMKDADVKGVCSIAVTGLDETFSRAVKDANLHEYIVNLVARLGGLVVLRDLARDSNWEALEREEAFRQVRQLLLTQGQRTVVGISLQAKSRVLGALLLGTPDCRSFTPAELRLLLALGQQIGMSIENSYLMQQSARRSEELHLLNEIGRALSSTLELDALLERIYSEMRRVLDVNNFFIAFYDQKAGEVRFEIEVMDGERCPKRSRPAGNHLEEYVVRSARPVLVRENYPEAAARLGFDELRDLKSICAVPLVLYDQPVGILAVHGAKERMFDEGHIELLALLASAAGIAIENARLFAAEQKKSRHLTLINNVSSHAITTLDTDEMLGRIASEVENHLPYDHIGIAIIDASAKELVVRAEAGARRDAVGRHIQLDEGLVGRAARSGQVEVAKDTRLSAPLTVLPGSAAALALPISYGERFLGVLYVESAEPCDFPDHDVQLLRTLADLFAGALHNALTFQAAQEQAITDGLTGVKTHRFLMEALSSEWKRSTRANRPFALVLMDLDRFKFVNDFYGHLEGDVVLQRVGHILEQNCRRSDVVARYGGDEFVVLMPETGIEQARQLANKLRGWVAADPLLRDKNITASFGIAAFPVHGSTPQDLIQVADSSMYLSKHQGGNSVSSAEQGDPNDRKRWKKDVLEAYLGVTLKRLFSTGPEAFDEIYRRLEQFTRSLEEQGVAGGGDELPPAVIETVTSLAFAIDAKDHYTQGHSRKVSAYAVMIAQALGMKAPEIEEIRLGGLLHDIGKVGIPEAILNKSGPLDATEWETMKTHTELGARILEPLKPMARIRQMVRHHHEFYDGSGYPSRLEGELIPFGARVIAVADAYDTITSARTYKKPRTPEDAFAELERCAANQFDPEIVRVFIDAMRRAPRLTLEAGIILPNPTALPAL